MPTKMLRKKFGWEKKMEIISPLLVVSKSFVILHWLGNRKLLTEQWGGGSTEKKNKEMAPKDLNYFSLGGRNGTEAETAAVNILLDSQAVGDIYRCMHSLRTFVAFHS